MNDKKLWEEPKDGWEDITSHAQTIVGESTDLSHSILEKGEILAYAREFLSEKQYRALGEECITAVWMTEDKIMIIWQMLSVEQIKNIWPMKLASMDQFDLNNLILVSKGKKPLRRK